MNEEQIQDRRKMYRNLLLLIPLAYALYFLNQYNSVDDNKRRSFYEEQLYEIMNKAHTKNHKPSLSPQSIDNFLDSHK